MYLPALPQIMCEFNLNRKIAQLTLTTWFLGLASMSLFMGVLSERYGRRSVLLLGGLIFLLGTILCTLAPNIWIFFLGRFLEGGMVASMLVPGYATIHELYPRDEAIKIFALIGSINVLAPALGPLFGGIVLYLSNWRSIFGVILLLSMVALLALQKVMPETLPPEKRLSINIPQSAKRYWNIISNKRFMLYMSVLGLIFSGWITWISAGSLLIIKKFQFSALAFGLIQALIFSVYILGTRRVKYLIELHGTNTIIWYGLLITLSAGFMILLLAFLFPNNLYLFLIALAFYTFGYALCFPSLNRVIIETSNEPMGIRVSLFLVFFTLYATLGSVMASFFFNGTIISLASLLTGAIVVASMLRVWIYINDKKR